ncbi:hypothetical protein [Gemmatimonas sp.]|jgi:hypothetical protein|uniref:hypothetical protein n=1 Tax=Gemmatimonas sp. TaxID=1962908 RepID=UPI0037BED69F
MKQSSVPALLLSAALSLAPAFAAAQTAVAPPEPRPAAISVAALLQPATAAAATPTAATPAAGPVAETQAVALKGRTAPAPLPAPAPRANTTSNRAMMIVGGVGLIVGGIIGDDAGTIVMIGSAGIGLIGLYRFLN